MMCIESDVLSGVPPPISKSDRIGIRALGDGRLNKLGSGEVMALIVVMRVIREIIRLLFVLFTHEIKNSLLIDYDVISTRCQGVELNLHATPVSFSGFRIPSE